MKKKMMTVFTIGVMSLSILGGASPSETQKGKTDYTQRSKEQLNNGKIHAVHTEEKAEKLEITVNYTDGLIEQGGISTDVFKKELGDEENGIAPGTKFDELPEDFQCPLCMVGKEMFSEVEE